MLSERAEPSNNVCRSNRSENQLGMRMQSGIARRHCFSSCRRHEKGWRGAAATDYVPHAVSHRRYYRHRATALPAQSYAPSQRSVKAIEPKLDATVRTSSNRVARSSKEPRFTAAADRSQRWLALAAMESWCHSYRSAHRRAKRHSSGARAARGVMRMVLSRDLA